MVALLPLISNVPSVTILIGLAGKPTHIFLSIILVPSFGICNVILTDASPETPFAAVSVKVGVKSEPDTGSLV